MRRYRCLERTETHIELYLRKTIGFKVADTAARNQGLRNDCVPQCIKTLPLLEVRNPLRYCCEVGHRHGLSSLSDLPLLQHFHVLWKKCRGVSRDDRYEQLKACNMDKRNQGAGLIKQMFNALLKRMQWMLRICVASPARVCAIRGVRARKYVNVPCPSASLRKMLVDIKLIHQHKNLCPVFLQAKPVAPVCRTVRRLRRRFIHVPLPSCCVYTQAH